jgi:hypothetical protein
MQFVAFNFNRIMTPNIKLRAFGHSAPKGFKPFGAYHINRGGLYARRDTRCNARLVATGVKPVAIDRVQRKKHLFLFLPRSRKVTKFPNSYPFCVFVA